MGGVYEHGPGGVPKEAGCDSGGDRRYATSFGVESTARHAYELGYNVTLAVDAMTDMNADAHTNSITRIFPRLGETGTAQQIIDLLDDTAEKASN